MTRRAAITGSVLFFLAGPGLEAGVGPFLLTRGWEAGEQRALLVVLGALLVAGGLAVLVRCFAGFALKGHGTPTPAAPTGALVAGGPYRWVRNPQHVATATVVVGEALLLARPVLLVAVAAYLLAMAGLVRRIEEPGLRARFGPGWEAYAARVPAWLPRPPGRRP